MKETIAASVVANWATVYGMNDAGKVGGGGGWMGGWVVVGGGWMGGGGWVVLVVE